MTGRVAWPSTETLDAERDVVRFCDPGVLGAVPGA